MATIQKKAGTGFYIVVIGGVCVIIFMGAASLFMKMGRETDGFTGSSASVGMIAPSVSGMYAPADQSGSGMALREDAYYDKSIAPYPLPPQSAGDTAATAEARIIKTGSLTLEVESARESAQKVQDVGTSRGGFVDNSNIVENNSGTVSGYVTIRVPSEKFDESMSAIRALGIRVATESTNGQDVTEQYTDLEARLKAAQAEEAQYLLILQKATSVQDILSVQSYLSNVRSNIESLQGQIKYLGNKTEYSTINVTLSEQANLQIPSQKFDLGRDIRLALHAVILLAQAFVSFFIWFVIIGGAFFIPLIIILYIAYRVIRHFVKK
jgi:hypothetical protein